MIQEFDTHTTPHRRHRGVESRIKVPFNGRVLDGSLVVTVCGKTLRNYFGATDVSKSYRDGSPYSTPCPMCFKEQS